MLFNFPNNTLPRFLFFHCDFHKKIRMAAIFLPQLRRKEGKSKAVLLSDEILKQLHRPISLKASFILISSSLQALLKWSANSFNNCEQVLQNPEAMTASCTRSPHLSILRNLHVDTPTAVSRDCKVNLDYGKYLALLAFFFFLHLDTTLKVKLIVTLNKY